MSDLIIKLGEILLLNLLLSGDNAVVISMAARNLSDENRRRAIVVGGVGAVGLRIIFTFIITFLLDIPFIHLIGGLLLLYIAFDLLRPEKDHDDSIRAMGSLWAAIRTIIIADAVMSLDNVVAITAAADGDFVLLIVGLALSIPIVMFGSELLSRLLNRFPILIYIGVFVLIVTAVEITEEESFISDWRHLERWETLAIVVVASIVVFGLGYLVRRRAAHHETEVEFQCRMADQESDTMPTSAGTAGAGSAMVTEPAVSVGNGSASPRAAGEGGRPVMARSERRGEGLH